MLISLIHGVQPTFAGVLDGAIIGGVVGACVGVVFVIGKAIFAAINKK